MRQSWKGLPETNKNTNLLRSSNNLDGISILICAEYLLLCKFLIRSFTDDLQIYKLRGTSSCPSLETFNEAFFKFILANYKCNVKCLYIKPSVIKSNKKLRSLTKYNEISQNMTIFHDITCCNTSI
jgi:hypothetical protein